MRIIGFENRYLEKIKDTVSGQRPADLTSGLPLIIRVYSYICEPYITGDVHTPLLLTVPLNMNEYKYGSIEIKNFTTPMYIPLLSRSFQSITIDIKDQDGNLIATYDNQSGHDPFDNYITIDTSMQKGKRVGNFFKSIYRSFLPLVKKGGKEALRAGVNILDDITHEKSLLKNLFAIIFESQERISKQKSKKNRII